MSIHGCLVLPPDVRIVPIPDLDPAVRAAIDASDDDYTITRLRSRTPSSVLDPDSAQLLESFRKPTRIVEAVAEFARQRGRDPKLTLDAAYPLLSRLYRRQLLVPEDSDVAAPIDSELKAGDTVLGFSLLRCVQVLDDNEVFLARNAEGRYAAVKFYRKADWRITRKLVREARWLRRLRGGRAPAAVGLLRAGSGCALVTEWISGSQTLDAAALLRESDCGRDESALLSLCIEVARAFADVHEQGVVHGDVHPRNILVEATGAVRLIDFGLARDIRRRPLGEPAGGVPFYLAPEIAEALREGQPTEPTPAAEQYSVAALLYELWTGVPYLDWSLERNEALRQIVQDGPVAFQTRGVPAWPSLERILRRALDKSFLRRFPDVRSLAEALASLVPESRERDARRQAHWIAAARANGDPDQPWGRYARIEEVLRTREALEAPVASISYGAGGIAYALLRTAQRRADARLLAAADLWTQEAYALAQRDDAFYNTELHIERSTVGQVSPFHSMSGLHLVRALVSAAQGDAASVNAALTAFVEHAKPATGRGDPSVSIDLVAGRAGLLLGCAELFESIPDLSIFDRDRVRDTGEQISSELIASIRAESIETSLLQTLGIAHGWAGLLFSLLRWAQAAGRDPDPVIRNRLRELAGMAEPSDAGIRWPTHTCGSALLDNWCNGSAGHAMLFASASQAFADAEFGRVAERAAISAWSSPTQIGTLCCGQGGIGYALLALHRLTGERIWLRRARTAARRAAADRSRHFGRDALYHGAVGVALLAQDVNEPAGSAMPLFEQVG